MSVAAAWTDRVSTVILLVAHLWYCWALNQTVSAYSFDFGLIANPERPHPTTNNNIEATAPPVKMF